MSQSSPHTALLHQWAAGDEEALKQLMPLVYDELRRLAAWYLQIHPGTIQPKTLVHELYIRLADGRSLSCTDRVQFFALAGQVMRRILIDRYRADSAEKRGGDRKAVTLDESCASEELRTLDLVALDQALQELTEMNPKGAKLVELRFFVGLTLEESAVALSISVASAKREWIVSRSWLQARLGGTLE